ncbi:MAG: selenium metabolism-associated LysR family transcriptional regulator [Coriobacteriia bacterium]
MNIAQVRTFLAVVEHGSFSAAAKAMSLSQPAVTMQLQSLEADVGATLLDRKYRKVELTEAGLALLPFARKMIEDVEAARQEIARLSESVTGRLRLAASTTPGQYVLPGLLGSFLADHGRVTISLRVMDTSQVVEAVESGEADLGVTGAEIRGAKVAHERLGMDELVLICPPAHRFAAQAPASLSEVVSEPFVMREEGSGTRLVMESELALAGIEPGDIHVITELGTGEAIVNAVEGGLGVAVVSSWVAAKALQLGTVSRIDVAPFPVSRPFYVVSPRGTMTRAAHAFLEHLQQAMPT